jgi:two-component system, NarL family, sensor kinase
MLGGMRRRALGRRVWRRVASPATLLALAGVASVAVIGVVLFIHLRAVGVAEAEREAERQAQLAAHGVVEPLVTQALVDGDPAAIDRIDRVVKGRVLRDPVVRVKVWAPDGRILYADDRRLIGERFELDADDVAVLNNGGVDSGLSDLSAPENRYEPRGNDLLEVYVPIEGPGGQPLLYESYRRFSSITASGRRIAEAILPALLGGLLVLQLANIALARWFAERLRRGDRERAALLRRALDASDLERRRLAADLHDGVVQDLTAVSLSVSAASRRLDGVADPKIVAELSDSAESARQSVGTLRSMLIEVYPPKLAALGLPAALQGLVDAAVARGLDAELEIDHGFSASSGAESLLFRAVQEGLRNAAVHAAADNVSVHVGTDGDEAWAEVTDDGRGFDPDAEVGEGHFGLRALSDLLVDAGGHLRVWSSPGGGTVLRAEVPAQ